MTIGENLSEFGGLPVVDYSPGQGLPDTAGRAWRLRHEWDGPPFVEHVVDAFLAEPDLAQVRALVVGMFTDDYSVSSQAVIDRLATSAHLLPALRALFLGDMTFEECEISWIHHGDVTQLAEAFPALESLGVRGGSEQIVVRPFHHTALRRLVLETGGIARRGLRWESASTRP